MVSTRKEDVCSGISYNSKNKIHAELQTDSEHVVLSPGTWRAFKDGYISAEYMSSCTKPSTPANQDPS